MTDEISSSMIQDDDLDEAEIQTKNRKRARCAGTSRTGGDSGERCNGRRVSATEGMLAIETAINNGASTLANAVREVAMILHSAEPAVAPSRPENVGGNANL